MHEPEVVLYTRRDCHLCDKAKKAIEASGARVTVTEIDIDGDPELRLRYNEHVPVVVIDGIEAFRHHVDPTEFAAHLRGERLRLSLAEEECVPCRGGVPPLTAEETEPLRAELDRAWQLVDGHHLERTFDFADFAGPLAFTNRVGAVAESQGHHPDICLGWGKVKLAIWTHKIDGLTRADFVLAAKIDRLER